MYSQVYSGEKKAPYVVHLVVDNDSDISDLPTHYAAGSVCRVINSSNVYMLNHDKQWVIQIAAGGGSGSGGTVVVEGNLATMDDINALFGK